MTRILHLTDIHFGGEEKAAVEAAVAFAHDAAPAVTLVTGDVTLNGLPVEFEAAAAWLERLPKPLVVIPGNHDTPYWNLPLRALTPFARFRRYIAPSEWAAFDAPELALRAANSARGAQPRPDWSKGAMKLAVCRRAVADFASAPAGALRVFACHHPLIEATGSPVSGDVRRGRLAAEVLADGGADLILTGHVHVPFAVPLALADERTYAVGAGTLSLRLRGAPASFNCIDWTDEDITVVAQAWSGSRYEPYRTWSLPRRHAEAASLAA